MVYAVAKTLLQESRWECRNGHSFSKDGLRSPHVCPECGTLYVRWVPLVASHYV